MKGILYFSIEFRFWSQRVSNNLLSLKINFRMNKLEICLKRGKFAPQRHHALSLFMFYKIGYIFSYN